MMIAIIILATLAAGVLIIWPALGAGTTDETGDEAALFRSQLAELDADVGSGRIADDQADSLRAELHRRLLRASRTAPLPSMTARPVLPLVAITALCLAAGMALYALRGNAGLPSAPPAAEPAPKPASTAQFARAQSVLLEDPSNIPAWVTLSDSLAQMGRTREAAEALTLASQSMPDSADLWVARGEALVRHAQGQVSPAARFAFNQASRIAPEHPAPRFYLALAWMQAARPREALATLEELAAQSAPDAPWMERVNRMMRGARTMLAAGIDGENSTVNAP